MLQEIPKWMAALVSRQALIKGAGHKYIRRVPKPGGGYRYYYNVTGGSGGLGHESEFEAGAAFKIAHGGKHGHFHVVEKTKDGRLKIRHDESGHETMITASTLRGLLHEHHAEAREAHRTRLKGEISAALKHGSKKQQARLLAEARKYGHGDLDQRKVEQGANAYVKAMAAGAKHLEAGGDDPRALFKAVGSKLTGAGLSRSQGLSAANHALKQSDYSPEGRAALLGAMASAKGPDVYARQRQITQAARNLAGGAPVTAEHVSAAVERTLPGGGDFAASFEQAASEADKQAELLKQLLDGGADGAVIEALQASGALAKLRQITQAYPGLFGEPAAQKGREVEAQAHAASEGREKGHGADTSIFVAGENGVATRVAAKYRVVEADQAIASHDPESFMPRKDYPEGLQERAYHRDKAEQGKVIRNAMKLKPEFVVNTNPDALNGPPVMNADGIVLGGNSRTMSMQRVYKEGGEQAKALREYLKANAHQMGLSPDEIEGFKSPILVRVVDTQGPEQDRALVRQTNETFTQGMDPRTYQVALGRKLDERTLGSLAQAMGPDDTLSSFLDSKASEGFVNELRRAGIIDTRNENQYTSKRDPRRLNADGKTLVARILVGRMVGNPDLLSETPHGIVESMARAVPYMIQAQAHGSGYDLSESLGKALDAYNDARQKGHKFTGTPRERDQAIDAYRRSASDMFTGDHPMLSDERAGLLFEAMAHKGGPVQMAKVFRTYAEQASHNVEGQGALFGDAKSPTDVLRYAVKGEGEATEAQAPLMLSLDASRRKHGLSPDAEAVIKMILDQGLGRRPGGVD